MWPIRADREHGEGVDEDEEHWQRKEARRLARDKAELNPLTLGARLGAAHLRPGSRQQPSWQTTM